VFGKIMLRGLATTIPPLLFLGGFCNNTIPIVVYWLQVQQGLSVVDATLLQATYFCGYLIMSLPSAILISSVGHKHALLYACLLASLAACLGIGIPSGSSFYLYLPVVFYLACAVTCLRTAALPYVATLKDDPAYLGKMNFFLAFDTLGAICAPTATTFLLYHIPMPISQTIFGAVSSLRPFFLFLLSAFTASILLIVRGLHHAPHANRHPFSFRDIQSVLQSFTVQRGFMSLFLFVGIEFSTVHYLISRLSDNPLFSETTIALMVGLYWAQMLLGRVVFAMTGHKAQARTQLIAPLVSALFLCAFAMLLPATWDYLPVLLLGLSNATLYPSLYSTFSKDTPLPQQHYVASTFLAATSGGAFLPYTLSAIMASSFAGHPLLVIVTAYALLLMMACRQTQEAVLPLKNLA
jgi:FHS family L-fucose permease-like MFS transporter